MFIVLCTLIVGYCIIYLLLIVYLTGSEFTACKLAGIEPCESKE